THRMRGRKGGSGDQIALKDGKHLLVVQYIWRGPFRASAMRRIKIAAVPAASDSSLVGGFCVPARLLRRRQEDYRSETPREFRPQSARAAICRRPGTTN